MGKKDTDVYKAWVQLSDLHVFDGTDTKIELTSYEELGAKLAPDFLIISGDFRHAIKQKDYSKSISFMESIAKAFKVKKEDIFIIPGNHDVNLTKNVTRDDRIKEIVRSLKKDGIVPSVQKLWEEEGFSSHFSEYLKFVEEFYGPGTVQCEHAKKTVYSITWKDSLNLIFLNTAIISNGKKHDELVDIDALIEIAKEDASTINAKLPSIVIGHHSLQDWNKTQREQFNRLSKKLNIVAYLCGDTHRANLEGSSKKDYGFPAFTCGKAAPEPGDDYSDISVTSYVWKNDSKVYVQAYDYGTKVHGEKRSEFLRSNHFIHDIDEPYSFYCELPEKQKKKLKQTKMINGINIPNGHKTTCVDIEMCFDTREDITYSLATKHISNVDGLSKFSHTLRWSGNKYGSPLLSVDSQNAGYKIISFNPRSSPVKITFDVKTASPMKIDDSGEYSFSMELHDELHNMVPCISRTVMRDTDRLIFTVTFEGDLIDSCEAFISLENVDIIEPRALPCKKLGAKLNKFSYEFSSEDIRLGFKHGIRWKFKDSVLP